MFNFYKRRLKEIKCQNVKTLISKKKKLYHSRQNKAIIESIIIINFIIQLASLKMDEFGFVFTL